VRLLSCLTVWALGCATVLAEQPRPAVLCLGSGGPEWPIAQKLSREHGLVFGARNFGDLTWEKLSMFNAVVLFDLSRLNPDTREINHVEISPAGFQRVSDLLVRFAEAGGGLYICGVSFVHMGQGWAAESLNRFLKRLDAQVLFEELHDAQRERQQPDGRKVTYALADRIEAHPATSDVRSLWYAVGRFAYGPWTRPLALGAEWKPLIFTSEQCRSTPLKTEGDAYEPTGAPSAVRGRAVIYAARECGQGRVVLNGGESTVSFFGYAFSAYADGQWGRIGMEAGLGGVPSDGLKLFVSSLKWLVEPSVRSGKLGGYAPPRPEPFKPRVASPIRWSPPAPTGEARYARGMFAAVPAVGGGSGSVADYAEAARTRGLAFAVAAGEFAKMDESAWAKLVAECRAATTADFLAVPALLTMDDPGNRFVQCGHQSWPKPERLSRKNPKRVQDHLGYWMTDCNFPLRAPYGFSKGQYPPWLHSGYNAFAVRTYEGGQVVDDCLEGFLQNQEQGDRSRILVMTFLTRPEQLADVREFTHIRADNRAQLEDAFLRDQFSGGSVAFVSSGPRVQSWQIAHGSRETCGQFYVPGTERWRASLRVASDVPLKSVTLYDSTQVFRRFAVTGSLCELHVDGLHDRRHVLTALVEDERGGRAVTSSIETEDNLFRQFFCSDRCNIMGGWSTLRLPDGHEQIIASTCCLYKAGRLSFSAVSRGEELPGIDGAGLGTLLSILPSFALSAEGGKEESRPPIHQINRPYDSADAIVFDTPILKRSASPGQDFFGHAPYVDLAEPKVGARLVQYHFYRKPAYPSPVMADLSLTIPDPEGVQLKAGWQGFSRQLAGSPGWFPLFSKWVLLRADGSRSEGPSADERSGTGWRGTLRPGDLLLLPDLGEGMFILAGEADIVIECVPSRRRGLFWLGRFAAPRLPAGATTAVRLLTVKTTERGAAALPAWLRFRDAFGIAGGKPAYTVTPTQGSVVSTRYLLELAAQDWGSTGAIARANLPQRLPIRVTGLNPKWTAGKVDLERKEWYPLGVWQGAAFTTLDTTEGDHRLYLGNLVTTDNPDLVLTLLPANADGSTLLDVHNPTDRAATAKVRVPVTTFLAKAQEREVTVPPMSSIRLTLSEGSR